MIYLSVVQKEEKLGGLLDQYGKLLRYQKENHIFYMETLTKHFLKMFKEVNNLSKVIK
jgi:hypothetical protein